MRGRMLKVLMVILVLIPVGLSAYLARSLYQRKGVPEALENLTRQLFQSKEDEHKAEKRAEQLERKAAELQSAYDALVADLHGEMDSKEVRIRRFKEALEINFVDKVLFASGSAEVTPHGRDVLSKVAGVLVKIKDKSIYVVGHTDTMPIHSALYPSNWELSTARSSAVIRFLSESGGVGPERFTAMGRAFYQPVASNATPEGRQENRRVDVIVADVPFLGDAARGKPLQGPGAEPGVAPPNERELGPGADGVDVPAVSPETAAPRGQAPMPVVSQPTETPAAPVATPEQNAPASPATAPAPETPAQPEATVPIPTPPAVPPAGDSAQPASPPGSDKAATPASAAPDAGKPDLPPALPAPNTGS